MIYVCQSVEPLETEEYENRTSINRALKRRWSTDSLENQSQKTLSQQKIRRFSAYDSAEGKDQHLMGLSMSMFVSMIACLGNI